MGSLGRLLPYLRRYGQAFWLGNLGLVLARLPEALIPLLLRDGIDAVAAARRVGAPLAPAAVLLWPSLGIAACVLVRLVLIVYSRRAVRQVGVAVSYDLRKRVYAHLQRQGPHFFARHATGDLMARAINDLGVVREVIGLGSRTAMVLGFSGLIGLAFMLATAPRLTLLLLAPMPVVGAVAWLLAHRIYLASLRVQAGFADLSGSVQENLNGIRTIQAQCQEEREIERFQLRNADYAARFHALMRLQSLLASWMPALGGACSLVILGVGASQVASGQLTLGTFTAFFSWLGMLLSPIREAGSVVNLFQRGEAAALRLFEILDSEPEIQDGTAAPRQRGIQGAIDVTDLTYRYPGSAVPALEHVSFAVAPGETLALIGRIGSGKSTLLRLLVRLLDPPPGSVHLDGCDVRSLPVALVREQVALTPQDPFLFAETVRHNLAYDDPRRDDKEVWRASELAALRSTLEALPDRLETLVGERGVTLSGGQKQRATLARGAIREAPILLLDDCFSSVDTETEEHILARLREDRRGRTTLLVSNRVSTVRHADRILVLEAGRIAESGSDRELRARGGIYARLARSQERLTRLEEPA